MSERRRLFVGIAVPDDRFAALEPGLEPLRSALHDARWIDASQVHVTLKFLGWVPPDLDAAVDELCEVVARGHPKAKLGLSVLGAFPTPRRARVLWAGIEDPHDRLPSLAADLDSAFQQTGFAAEDRRFVPHLTLARARTPRGLPVPLPELPQAALRPFEISQISLYRSHLSSKGARYEVVKRFPLSGGVSR